MSHEISLPFCFWPVLTQWIMAILSKGCKPDTFESHHTLELSLKSIWGLCLNFVECESFFESNSPDVLALCETNLNDSTDPSHFSVTIYPPLIQKGSIAMEFTPRKFCGFLLMFSTGFTSLNVLLLFPLLITFFLFMHDSIPPDTEEVLSINPSPNVFVFGDFNATINLSANVFVFGD